MTSDKEENEEFAWKRHSVSYSVTYENKETNSDLVNFLIISVNNANAETAAIVERREYSNIERDRPWSLMKRLRHKIYMLIKGWDFDDEY